MTVTFKHKFRQDNVVMFVDGNYVYKCMNERYNANELVVLLQKVFSKIDGQNDLRRIYYYNSYPPLESDRKKRESVSKLIWQVEKKTNQSIKATQDNIKKMCLAKKSEEEIIGKLNMTLEEYKAQKFEYISKLQTKFYEVLQYKGLKVILNKLKKNPKGGYYQKGVDIYIASDMLSMAFENAYDTAVLISGDADFIEVVNKIQEKGKQVFLACFEDGKSWDLQKICDGYLKLDDIR